MSSSELALNQTIVEALKVVPGVRLAMVFGSIAVGAENSESDLDLAVDAGRPLTPQDKANLISELGMRTGRPVDLVDLQTVGEPLLGQIVKHGRRIVGTTTDFANLLRKHLFDTADFGPYRDRILRERKQAWIGK